MHYLVFIFMNIEKVFFISAKSVLGYFELLIYDLYQCWYTMVFIGIQYTFYYNLSCINLNLYNTRSTVHSFFICLKVLLHVYHN